MELQNWNFNTISKCALKMKIEYQNLWDVAKAVARVKFI